MIANQFSRPFTRTTARITSVSILDNAPACCELGNGLRLVWDGVVVTVCVENYRIPADIESDAPLKSDPLKYEARAWIVRCFCNRSV